MIEENQLRVQIVLMSQLLFSTIFYQLTRYFFSIPYCLYLQNGYFQISILSNADFGIASQKNHTKLYHCLPDGAGLLQIKNHTKLR